MKNSITAIVPKNTIGFNWLDFPFEIENYNEPENDAFIFFNFTEPTEKLKITLPEGYVIERVKIIDESEFITTLPWCYIYNPQDVAIIKFVGSCEKPAELIKNNNIATGLVRESELALYKNFVIKEC